MVGRSIQRMLIGIVVVSAVAAVSPPKDAGGSSAVLAIAFAIIVIGESIASLLRGGPNDGWRL